MTRKPFSNTLDVAIFTAVGIVLLALFALLSSNLVFQYLNYRTGIRLAESNQASIDHTIILTYSRAWDFAVAKTSALFLSFLLIFTGALYVLRSAESRYEVTAEKGDWKGSLSISSPGLVMVTLGVCLVAYVLSNKTTIEYSRGLAQRPQHSLESGPPPQLPTPNSAEDTEMRKEPQ